MIRVFSAIGICILLVSSNVGAQSRKKRGQTIAKCSVAIRELSSPPAYTFLVSIGANRRANISVTTSHEGQTVDPSSVKDILSGLLTRPGGKPKKAQVDTLVVITPDPSLDLKTVADVVKGSRVSAAMEVRLRLPDGTELGIPMDPKFIPPCTAAPNPLSLTVAIQDDGEVTLNNGEYGDLSDLSRLTKDLEQIFHERAESGVYRDGTTDVEKTVSVKPNLSRTFADIIKLATAIRSAGSDRIWIRVDAIEPAIIDRKELLK